MKIIARPTQRFRRARFGTELAFYVKRTEQTRRNMRNIVLDMNVYNLRLAHAVQRRVKYVHVWTDVEKNQIHMWSEA